MSVDPQPVLHLFAKTPIAGRVKTRLATHCSPRQAAAVAAWCIEQTVHLSLAAWPGPLRLWVWPDPAHPVIQGLRAQPRLSIARQAAGDLGKKMHAAFRASAPSAVMGCDVPHCPPEFLTRTYRALVGGGDVIGPSDDGGYYLIALSQPQPSLFAGVNWGSDGVLAFTLNKAAELGVVFEQLPALTDLDTWNDIEQVQHHFRPLRRLIQELGTTSKP